MKKLQNKDNKPVPVKTEPINRRDFFNKAWTGLGILAGIEVIAMLGGFIALSLRCTHLGCSIAWEEDKKRFICPCHSSAFDISGEVLNPPAARALDYYPVIIENNMVKVDIGTLVERSSFKKDQLQYA